MMTTVDFLPVHRMNPFGWHSDFQMCIFDWEVQYHMFCFPNEINVEKDEQFVVEREPMYNSIDKSSMPMKHMMVVEVDQM